MRVEKTPFSDRLVQGYCTTDHPLQMEKSLNNVILKRQALCEHWKHLAGSWLDRFDSCPSRSFTACHGRDPGENAYETLITVSEKI